MERIVQLLCLLLLRGGDLAAAQSVTLESPSPQPTCPHQVLVYNCQLEFPATFMQWEHPNFGNLGFAPSGSNVGDMKNSSDNRVVATLTRNDETSPGLGQFMMASTLTIYPPLNGVNGSNLNNTVLTCRGAGVGVSAEDASSGTDIMLTGEPSPPHNLRNATPDDMPSTTIEWDPPVYTGGSGMSIQMYKIRIPEGNYLKEGNSTVQSHTIREGSHGIKFNTLYEVEATAINQCDDESNPTIITINIEASGPPPLAFLGATFECGTGSIEKGHLHWEYGPPLSSVHTPTIDDVVVEVNGPTLMWTSCSNLTVSHTNCSFNITEGGIYTLLVKTTNSIDMVSNDIQYALTLDPFSVNYSSLTSDVSPGISVTLSSLCAEPLNDFVFVVLFGIQRTGQQYCVFKQSKTMLFTDSRTVFVPLDTDIVTIPTDQAADYEYCAKVLLNNDFLDVCPLEEKSEETSFSVGVASGITFVLTLLVVLPLGILIGCCGSWYRRQFGGKDSGKSLQQVGAIYEEPGPVEAAIPLSENLAYGPVQGQRRK